MPRIMASLLIVTGFAFLAGASLSSCDSDPALKQVRLDEQLLEQFDLTEIPVSPELAPYLQISRERFSAPQPENQLVRDIDTLHRLREQIPILETKTAATEELADLWRNDPRNFLWSTLVCYTLRFHDYSDLVNEVLSLPEIGGADDPVRLFIEGFYKKEIGEGNGSELIVAWEKRQELDPVQTILLARELAYYLSSHDKEFEAIEILLSLLDTANRLAGHRLEMLLWFDLANSFLLAERQDNALHAIKLAIDHFHKADYTGYYIRSLHRLGKILAARNEFEAAIQIYEIAARFGRDASVIESACYALDQAAMLYSYLGRPAKALPYDKQSLELARASEDYFALPHVLINIADDFRLMGELDSSFVYVNQARAAVKLRYNAENLARLPLQEAEYYAQIGDYAMVDSLLKESVRLEPSDPFAVARARLLLRQIEQGLRLGHASTAYNAISQLEQLAPTLMDGDADLRMIYEVTTATFLSRQGNAPLARRALTRAREVMIKTGGVENRYLYNAGSGEVALSRDDHLLARESYKTCLEIAEDTNNREWIHESRLHIAKVDFFEGNYQAVLDTIEAADPDLRFGGNYRNQLSMIILKAITLYRADRLEEAISAFTAAMDFSNSRSPDDVMILLETEFGRCLLAASRPREADTYLTRARQRLSRDVITGGIPGLSGYIDNPLLQLTEAQLDLYNQYPEFAPDGNPALQKLSLIETYLENWKQGSGRLITATQLKKLLPVTDNPILVYFVGDITSNAFLIKKGRVKQYTLPGRQELKKRVDRILADTDKPTEFDIQEWTQFSRLILSPIAEEWGLNTTLQIVPHDLLCNIPWGALYLPDQTRSLQPEMLIDHGSIAIHHSISSITSRNKASKCKDLENPLLLSVGHNGTAGPNKLGRLAPLHHAEAEAREIGQIWPWKPTTVKLNSAATWGNITKLHLKDYAVFHIASHLLIQYGSDSRMTVYLADDSTGTPLIPDEIYKYGLQPDLVFISCCEGAAGSRKIGLLNFAEAFLNNGVNTVIASTQPIDDEAARWVATRFYKEWIGGKSKSEALRSAQLALRATKPDWKHPYFWAYYMVYGSSD